MNNDLNFGSTEDSFDDHQNFGEPQENSSFMNQKLGDWGGDEGSGSVVETGYLAKISEFDNPLPFEDNNLNDSSNNYLRLQNSIFTELGVSETVDNQLSQSIEHGKSHLGVSAYNICKNIISDDTTNLAQEQTLDRMAGLVCGKLQSNPNEMMDVYFSGEGIMDDCGLQSPTERWDAFIEAYNFANENSGLPLNELIENAPNIEQGNINAEISQGINSRTQSKEISFSGGIGICGMQCLHGCTSIITEDNQNATYVELSEYNS